jgi:signal-transduction protein with cAMP-binding, CBS, and nucleotidyltransferase domain
MGRSGQSRLMVVEDGRLAGILALKDLADVLSVKMALEGERR